ncbi:MAG: hypothetical protein JSW10_10520 [Pseudomonadota bacterium]|nr:MAG: hypothetical protein JSW10_10520 [Pseudomonadota bacterium]
MSLGSKADRPRLVWDARRCERRPGGLRVVAAPQAQPPFRCAAIAEEQDTCLILGAQRELQAPDTPAWALANRLAAQHTHATGTVVVRCSTPLRLLAIVHDVEQTPTWREEWIAGALRAILLEVERRELASLALPMLGTRFGKLSSRRFVRLLSRALAVHRPACMRRLWLSVPNGTSCSILDALG